MRKGDERAFRALYDRYWKKLLVRARLMLDSCPEAEELVHDIFVKLWRKRETIVIQHGFHTYIAAMLKYDTFRRLATRRSRGTVVLSPDLEERPDAVTQEWLDYAQLREQLEKAVRLLPEQGQLIFRLSREQGLSDKEIAARLGIALSTVRTQMYRSLRKLKIALDHFFLL
jgi:RNA polymerase sigma-70 factor (ECF subfamily)